MDNVNRRILHILKENPYASQKDIAKMINLSQPSVSARIKKLREEGLLAHFVGVDIKKVGLHVGEIEVEKLDEKFENCPRILSILKTSDGYIVFIISEDYSSMEYFVKKNFGKEPKIIIGSIPDFIMPLKFEENSCESQCDKCPYYKNGQCSGCPLSPFYKGEIWNKGRR